MNCQHCGHSDTQVLETRSLMGGAVVRRRRVCADCGESFATYEIDDGVWNGVKNWTLSSHIKALKKKHDLRKRDGKIVSMIKAGRELKEIAAKFGVSVRTVSYAASKAGLEGTRGPKRKKPVANPWSGLL